MHKTVAQRHEEDSLSLHMSTKVGSLVWRTRHEARSAAACKLVQSKAQEEDSAVAYGKTVVAKNKLTSRSYVATA
jgi:hypothetical protein